MKICELCHKKYTDIWRFCLDCIIELQDLDNYNENEEINAHDAEKEDELLRERNK